MNRLEWHVEFYETENNSTPVLDFILGLSFKEKAKVLHHLDLLKELFPWDVEHVKKLEDQDFWELRIKFSSNHHRVLFFLAHEKRFVLIHGFTKKDWQISPRDLALAQRRKVDWERRFLK
jgi:phage-related protein